LITLIFKNSLTCGKDIFLLKKRDFLGKQQGGAHPLQANVMCRFNDKIPLLSLKDVGAAGVGATGAEGG
jgi:hypothetical protein